MQGKGMLQLSGLGDPTRCGDGFSYMRVPHKVFMVYFLKIPSKIGFGFSNLGFFIYTLAGATTTEGIPTQAVRYGYRCRFA